MSELKEHQFCESDEFFREYHGPLSNEMRPYYLKSEADKVIAEKDKELRRQKYKRCLDKAEMCQARYDEEDAKVNGHYSSWYYTSEEMKYWERWHYRWLELAEKFKEASR